MQSKKEKYTGEEIVCPDAGLTKPEGRMAKIEGPANKDSEGNEKPPKVKKEKVSKFSEKSTTKTAVPKPEMVIPEIVIPINKPSIKREDGPSPFNGTIKYDNKIFLGAHIPAAGDFLFLSLAYVCYE